jgi:hypothetical protein
LAAIDNFVDRTPGGVIMTIKHLKTTALIGSLTVALAAAFFAGEATARQPHMQAALNRLEAARDQLQIATPNKGGHRVEALRLTNAAIGEVKAGMEHAEDW